MLLSDLVHARSGTPLDLKKQAGPGAAGKNGIATGADKKGPLQDGQSLVDRPDRGEGTEIITLSFFRPPMLEDLREFMVAGDQNGREGLVIPEQDIIARRQPFDQVGFQQQGFRLRMGGDEFHGGGFHDHAPDTIGLPVEAGVTGNPFFQVLGLAHIQHITGLVDHPVDARRPRQSGHIALDYPDSGLRRGIGGSGRFFFGHLLAHCGILYPLRDTIRKNILIC